MTHATAVPANPAPTATSRRSPLDRALLGLAMASALVGDILGFNQLATQSATDAILPVLVFAVAGVGAIETARRVVFGRTRADRLLALPFALLAIGGFVTWRIPWSTGAMTLLTVLSGLLTGCLGASNLWWNRDETASDTAQILGLVVTAQGLLLLYFASLAIGDINGPFFG